MTRDDVYVSMTFTPLPLSTLLTALSFGLLAGCSTISALHEPLPNASHRATPLHFGLQVSPKPDENPIDPPERFSGYHAATDYEVSAGEVDGDVPVYAICDGEVAFSGFAGGYGGLVVQRCVIQGALATVLYGHLQIASLPEEGAELEAGDAIGLLGAARSYDTDGNRKHLHLGIHKGRRLDVRGYVQSQAELAEYLDPATVLAQEMINLTGQSPGETPYWQKTGSGSSLSSGE